MKVIEDRNYLSDNEEDTYHFSSEDIGCKLYCVVSYEPGPDTKFVECLSFGPIELAPHLRLEIENNLVSNSCMYTPLLRTNPDANQIKGKGIRVNIHNQNEQFDDLSESKKGK